MYLSRKFCASMSLLSVLLLKTSTLYASGIYQEFIEGAWHNVTRSQICGNASEDSQTNDELATAANSLLLATSVIGTSMVIQYAPTVYKYLILPPCSFIYNMFSHNKISSQDMLIEEILPSTINDINAFHLKDLIFLDKILNHSTFFEKRPICSIFGATNYLMGYEYSNGNLAIGIKNLFNKTPLQQLTPLKLFYKPHKNLKNIKQENLKYRGLVVQGDGEKIDFPYKMVDDEQDTTVRLHYIMQLFKESFSTSKTFDLEGLEIIFRLLHKRAENYDPQVAVWEPIKESVLDPESIIFTFIPHEEHPYNIALYINESLESKIHKMFFSSLIMSEYPYKEEISSALVKIDQIILGAIPIDPFEERKGKGWIKRSLLNDQRNLMGYAYYFNLPYDDFQNIAEHITRRLNTAKKEEKGKEKRSLQVFEESKLALRPFIKVIHKTASLNSFDLKNLEDLLNDLARRNLDLIILDQGDSSDIEQGSKQQHLLTLTLEPLQPEYHDLRRSQLYEDTSEKESPTLQEELYQIKFFLEANIKKSSKDKSKNKKGKKQH